MLPTKPTIAYGGPYKAGGWYPYGWCTFLVAEMRGGVRWPGNASEWLAGAKDAGVQTGNKPVEGAILVTNEGGWTGHVAFVTKVNKDGSFVVSEMNYVGFGVVSSRTIKAGSSIIRGFIL